MSNFENNPYRTPQAAVTVAHGGDSVIQVSRNTSYADRLGVYRILVDGVERARLKAGATVEIPVNAGNHTISARIDWCGSPDVNVTASPHKLTTLHVARNLQGKRIFLVILYITLFRDQYLSLTRK